MLQSDAQEDDDLQVSFVQKAAVAKTALRLVKKAGVVPSKSDEDMIRSKLISIFRDAGKKFKSPLLDACAQGGGGPVRQDQGNDSGYDREVA